MGFQTQLAQVWSLEYVSTPLGVADPAYALCKIAKLPTAAELG